MTKKDYELLAEAIANAKIYAVSKKNNGFINELSLVDTLAGITYAQEAIANALSIDNFRFDSERFHDACEA